MSPPLPLLEVARCHVRLLHIEFPADLPFAVLFGLHRERSQSQTLSQVCPGLDFSPRIAPVRGSVWQRRRKTAQRIAADRFLSATAARGIWPASLRCPKVDHQFWNMELKGSNAIEQRTVLSDLRKPSLVLVLVEGSFASWITAFVRPVLMSTCRDCAGNRDWRPGGGVRMADSARIFATLSRT